MITQERKRYSTGPKQWYRAYPCDSDGRLLQDARHALSSARIASKEYKSKASAIAFLSKYTHGYVLKEWVAGTNFIGQEIANTEVFRK